jgi:surface antigen
LFEEEASPETTGSIAPPVEVQRPLPPTLAFSDATRIGQAATAALAQAEGSAMPEEWINTSTGSSGTLEPEAANGSAAGENCRQFSTIVTSIGGVHRYSGAICQDSSGRAVVQIGERGGEERI